VATKLQLYNRSRRAIIVPLAQLLGSILFEHIVWFIVSSIVMVHEWSGHGLSDLTGSCALVYTAQSGP